MIHNNRETSTPTHFPDEPSISPETGDMWVLSARNVQADL
jgi:hypothetical protein